MGAIRMPLIEQTLEGKINKVKIAIERIKNFCPITNGFMDEPYFVGYSGGKDSDALRILFELSGVKHDLVHNHTTVDAPETVNYIRSIPNVEISYPKMSMWELIVKKGIPPTRQMRYCCSELKERGGVGRFISTGVRWSESVKRKSLRGLAEVQTRKVENKLTLLNDNAENRRLFETCQLKGRRVVNPIIDWNDEDVWELLKHHGCKSNPLYEEGSDRIGCIGCPLASKQKQIESLERYPKYKEAYLRAFEQMLKRRLEIGMMFEKKTSRCKCRCKEMEECTGRDGFPATRTSTRF